MGECQRRTRCNLSFQLTDRGAIVIASGYLFLELDILCFGLSIDGKIEVSVFPNGKEFFVRFTAGCVVAHHFLHAAELESGPGVR